ncbi:MAG: homocysteine S-methyltransferase family protein [Gammaproteobacteria bacterium]|nr:homocysteine S-methyltransferase family protein [Gammaproteobacteria bacterium]MCZ6579850.1 homocysteine S-methyltransferase family protein [Gammaproteobacteria bacterium]MCZ6668293.1 homocysteine S-methyltransferase family protein [Gammaproteobacteria bacterium]MCZ6722573.1 homocysteine S-methyltransferase family protein [Gammaproteobacteria bacterium]MCZ6798730.1 homocysteine S-methyltransferase family protein [Gammaproteobacteria bacterium]
MVSLQERLDNNEIILMDGGISTEIQKRGVPLDPNVWSGLTTKTHPDEVRQVHEDYIRAGSQVITANTYSTARHVLESINLGHEAKMINLKSVQLAREARDNAADGDVWIAGSMSSMPPLTSSQEVAVSKHAEASYQELAEVLANAGVDLIIAEMMRDIDNATMVIKAAVSTGLPVWVGYSTMMAEDGIDVRSLRWKSTDSPTDTHDFASLVEQLSPLGGQAAGIMHTQVGDIGPALGILGKLWSGPKLAYAETGQFLVPDWSFEEICTPRDYAKQVEDWIKNHGVQIIGGCCGTGPEHIRALKNLLTEKL